MSAYELSQRLDLKPSWKSGMDITPLRIHTSLMNCFNKVIFLQRWENAWVSWYQFRQKVDMVYLCRQPSMLHDRLKFTTRHLMFLRVLVADHPVFPDKGLLNGRVCIWKIAGVCVHVAEVVWACAEMWMVETECLVGLRVVSFFFSDDPLWL